MAQTKEVSEYINETAPCFVAMTYSRNGMWAGTNPLVQAIPLFIIQLSIVTFVTRLFLLLFKPFHHPPFIAQLIGGIFIGPSGLGRFKVVAKLFPPGSMLVFDPMAYFAAVYFSFLAGLEMDLTPIPGTGMKSLTVAISGSVFPLALGSGLFFMFCQEGESRVGFMFWATALTVTGYSVLAQSLVELRILDTEIGRRAMSSALINDLVSWVFLALSIPFSGKISAVHWSLLCLTAFVAICVYYLRPALVSLIDRTPEGYVYSEFYLCSFLAIAGLCGVLTDAFGSHPIIGAFIFGLIVPKGELQATLLEKAEEFVMGLLMPVFFAACGLRTDVYTLMTSDYSSCMMVLWVMILACLAKVLSALFPCVLCGMPVQEGLPLGVLMNTKSVLAMIILHVGLEQKALTKQTYTIMVIPVMVMTMMVAPIVTTKTEDRKSMPYRRRTIEKLKPKEEFRILACVHKPSNVSSIITLLEASNPTKESGINVFALQLVDLVGRAAAMRVVQLSRKTFSKKHSIHLETDQIIRTFESYARRKDFISIQKLHIRSPCSAMGEDICCVAEEKRTVMIILPFHKQLNVAGEMEETKPAIRDVNDDVSANAPCSVGVLIDRGLAASGDFPGRVAMLYMGGPDDREALSYALRMAKRPEINLNVVRIIPGEFANSAEPQPMGFANGDGGVTTVDVDSVREKQLDDAFLDKFRRLITRSHRQSVKYSETVLNNEEELVEVITSMDCLFDLYLVGKGRGVSSPLTTALLDWCDYPELGAMGNLLVTSQFSSAFAVLVVQQYYDMLSSVTTAAGAVDVEEEGGVDRWPSTPETATDFISVAPTMDTAPHFSSLGSSSATSFRSIRDSFSTNSNGGT